MDGTTAIVVAIITALGTVLVGWLALRGTNKASEAKQAVDENATALEAWRELVQPLRDENARLVAQLEHEREEHAAEMAALENLKRRKEDK